MELAVFHTYPVVPPPPRGVKAYPAREAHGLVFIFPGNPDHANRVPLPDIPECRSRKFLTIRFRRQINCHYSFLHENLMDMSHQFLHRRWMGKFIPAPLRTRTWPDGVEVDYAAELNKGSLILRFLPSIILDFQTVTTHFNRRQASAHPRTNEDYVTISTHYPFQLTMSGNRPTHGFGPRAPNRSFWVRRLALNAAGLMYSSRTATSTRTYWFREGGAGDP
jgi:phenylpropionate dioxygenase-like ring-hydroxylating dioxygenase large terminal subunit